MHLSRFMPMLAWILIVNARPQAPSNDNTPLPAEVLDAQQAAIKQVEDNRIRRDRTIVLTSVTGVVVLAVITGFLMQANTYKRLKDFNDCLRENIEIHEDLMDAIKHEDSDHIIVEGTEYVLLSKVLELNAISRESYFRCGKKANLLSRVIGNSRGFGRELAVRFRTFQERKQAKSGRPRQVSQSQVTRVRPLVPPQPDGTAQNPDSNSKKTTIQGDGSNSRDPLNPPDGSNNRFPSVMIDSPVDDQRSSPLLITPEKQIVQDRRPWSQQIQGAWNDISRNARPTFDQTLRSTDEFLHEAAAVGKQNARNLVTGKGSHGTPWGQPGTISPIGAPGLPMLAGR